MDKPKYYDPYFENYMFSVTQHSSNGLIHENVI